MKSNVVETLDCDSVARNGRVAQQPRGGGQGANNRLDSSRVSSSNGLTSYDVYSLLPTSPDAMASRLHLSGSQPNLTYVEAG